MRWLRILGWTVGGLVVVLVALFVLLQTPPGLRTIAHLVSSSDLSVSGLSGFIPTDLQVKRIELRDKQGVWLSLDDARVRWSFASLFSGRVRVEELRAAKIDVVRPPQPSEEKASSSSSGSFGIPVGVDLRAGGRLAALRCSGQYEHCDHDRQERSERHVSTSQSRGHGQQREEG